MEKDKAMRDKNSVNRVMVADDDMFVRKIVRSVLMEFAEVIEVEDGNDVFKTYKEKLPDILFLDIHLPNQSGLDLLKQIRAFDPRSHIIMLSADSTVDNVQRTKDLGVMGFLTKPFAKNRIMQLLNKCPTIQFTDIATRNS